MDPQASPPKRMTRARAAAKATESSIKPTKIVTAAAKAKATRATSATIASKRKTRADDVDTEDEDELPHAEPEQPLKSAMKPAAKATRGRPKKVMEPEPEAAPAPAPRRGRPPKKATAEPVKEEPVRTTRTRAKKVQTDEEADEINSEPVKKITRGRAATVTKPAVKKSVKFEEPDKENVVPPSATAKGKPAAKAAESTAPGLRGRPVRKAATPVTRTTRTAKSSTTEKNDSKAPTPLSPKKVTQMPISRDSDSEDELGATPRQSFKSLKKGPVKASLGGNVPKLAPEHASTDVEEEQDVTTTTSFAAPSIILGSPVRRPAPSPFKDAMKSPARRVDSIPSLGLSTNKSANDTTQSPHKASLLQSPAKRPAASPMKSSFGVSASGVREQSRSPMKLSLLQASAKRPASPVKNAIAYKAPAPTMLSTPLVGADASTESKELNESMDEMEMALNDMEAEMMPDSPTRLRFPGRLSAVLPRHADPILNDVMLAVPESAEGGEEAEGQVVEYHVEAEQIVEDLGDPMEVDEPEIEQPGSTSTTPPQSPPKHKLGMFDLRQKDLAPYDEVSESEDELASSGLRGRPSSSAILGTPCPASSRSSRSRTSNAFAKKLRTSNFGFTPLAKQLSEWTGASPLKSGSQDQTPARAVSEAENVVVEESPLKNTFFEDEMSVRPEAVEEETVTPDVEEPVFDDVPVTEEDMALAAEANEMSLMEPETVEDLLNLDTPDDSMSEASQEYGDENEVPIDPALQNGSDPMVPPVTPKRIVMREFHTVSKVPLKAEDNSTPRPVMKKRSHSISRLPVQRPTQGLTRSATVISYSPMKKRRESTVFDTVDDEDQPRAGSAPPVTPTKTEVGWSTAGTPARTPRRDVNPALLSGAVVFVDVHTSEGADASGIFVELLTQMGARCVKSWPWNPSSPPSKESAALGAHKVGITHVVYKDGGKRTMEKVRESDGVVQCVGVSWVLDCERENEWLEEAPYYIDTSMVPRGGHRRRKSMEPRAFANLNGMLVPTPVKGGGNGTTRQSQSLPATPVNRRDSALWMHTPEDEDNEDPEADGIHEDDWEVADMLTPVPVTPAPEAIARFALDVTPETPSTDAEGEDPLATMEVLMTRTCPPKPSSSCQQLGEGILRKEKDQGVMMRLMAARRKSLQFAPKVGSPLAKAWP